VQEGIIVMNESAMICPLLNITPKVTPTSNEADVSGDNVIHDKQQEDQPKSGKFSLGKFWLILVSYI
jgi:hypothetical protein